MTRLPNSKDTWLPIIEDVTKSASGCATMLLALLWDMNAHATASPGNPALALSGNEIAHIFAAPCAGFIAAQSLWLAGRRYLQHMNP